MFLSSKAAEDAPFVRASTPIVVFRPSKDQILRWTKAPTFGATTFCLLVRLGRQASGFLVTAEVPHFCFPDVWTYVNANCTVGRHHDNGPTPAFFPYQLTHCTELLSVRPSRRLDKTTERGEHYSPKAFCAFIGGVWLLGNDGSLN